VVARDRLIGATVCLWEATSEAEVKRMDLSLFRALLEDMAAPISALEVCLSGQGDHAPRLIATGPAVQEHLAQINEGLARFKEYAEILFGQVAPARATFKPLQLLGLARKTLAAAAKTRKVFLEEAPTRDLPDLQGDAAYLNRILGLVVDFVMKSVPAGQMVIMAGEVLTLPDGDVRLVYSITGTGWVPHEALLRSLTDHRQEFYLGRDDEEKRQILRLFVARRLVQALNGSFTPAAHEKAGTTFSISVPVSIFATALPAEAGADPESAPAS
jgi:K+-sensing histidine kinase KdpD